MSSQNLVVITGNQLAHKYFENQLGARYKLAAIFREHFEYPEPSFNSNGEKGVWQNFFSRRQLIEKTLLNYSEKLAINDNTKIFDIQKGALNDDSTIKLIGSFNPTKILIFGTSLLNNKFLDLFPNCIFNLHVGLSQYYRGSSCNFWPIFDLRL